MVTAPLAAGPWRSALPHTSTVTLDDHRAEASAEHRSSGSGRRRRADDLCRTGVSERQDEVHLAAGHRAHPDRDRVGRDSPACQRIAVKADFSLAGTVSSVGRRGDRQGSRRLALHHRAGESARRSPSDRQLTSRARAARRRVAATALATCRTTSSSASFARSP